jgi:hypothetical protein
VKASFLPDKDDRPNQPAFPIFLVAENHDIDYTSSKIKKSERKLTTGIFESLYRAKTFDFVFNHCLFIIGGVNPLRSEDYLN